MLLKGRDIISVRDLSREDMEQVFKVAEKMEAIAAQRTKSTLLMDKILATLFFQPSTRTRLSFESAMQRLGGSVLGFASPEVTRAGDVYAETLRDTGRMIQLYSDVIVIRHPQADAPSILAETVESARDIDVARSEAAKKRAEERLKLSGPDIDFERAQLAIFRALNRLKISKKI